MFGKLDEIINKFIAVFLFPLMNITVVIFIVYFITAPSIHAGRPSAEINSAAIQAVAGFIQANLEQIKQMFSPISSALGAISSIVGAAVFFSLVMMIYLIDRIFFYVGYFISPRIEFDLDSFEPELFNSNRGRALRSLYKSDIRLTPIYGAVRAYLSHKNADQYRIAFRNGLVSGIDSTQKVSYYTAAYFLFALIVIVGTLYAGQHVSWMGALVILVILAAIFLGTVRHYSKTFACLVEYDLDSYLWQLCYEPGSQLDVAALENYAGAFKKADGAARDLLKTRWHLKSFWSV